MPPGASRAAQGTYSLAAPIAQPSAANENLPIFTGGPDGLRMWINGKVVAYGLRFLQANDILKRFKERAS
jgi:hypothetical protein